MVKCLSYFDLYSNEHLQLEQKYPVVQLQQRFLFQSIHLWYLLSSLFLFIFQFAAMALYSCVLLRRKLGTIMVWMEYFAHGLRHVHSSCTIDRSAATIPLNDAAKQHLLFPVLDYIAKSSYKQTQILQEIKTEINVLKQAQQDLKELVEQLENKESLNIDKYKVHQCKHYFCCGI